MDKIESWQAGIAQWVAKRKKLPNEITEDLIQFFERAFEHTRHPELSWFGIHPNAISLAIGGIYLAAINNGSDRGAWLLISKELDIAFLIMM